MRKRSGQVHSRESSATLQLTVSLLYQEAGIRIAFDELALYNCDMNKVVESGMFRIVLMDQDRELWQGELKVTE